MGKILQLLRLRQINNATFLKVNFATMTMLQCVEPYVTYGKPSLKTINDLVYKRGFGKVSKQGLQNGRVSKQRVPLTENKVISESLAKHDVICVEDVIHEIHLRTSFQGSQQLPLAVQAQQPSRW